MSIQGYGNLQSLFNQYEARISEAKNDAGIGKDRLRLLLEKLQGQSLTLNALGEKSGGEKKKVLLGQTNDAMHAIVEKILERRFLKGAVNDNVIMCVIHGIPLEESAQCEALRNEISDEIPYGKEVNSYGNRTGLSLGEAKAYVNADIAANMVKERRKQMQQSPCLNFCAYCLTVSVAIGTLFVLNNYLRPGVRK